MGRQVEELKTTIAQLKASQAQMAREFAKASAAETRPAEQNLGPRVSALTPPAPRPAVPPPPRKPKPAYSYSPAPIAAAPAAPLAPAQAAAPLPPPAPPKQAIADDGEPVVRPPMPLR